MSYTKLFSTIVTSTIWTESAETCKVWVTMLALSNKHGEVMASIPGLAQVCALPLEIVESAVEKFQQPDKYSRTPDDEGRRIEKVEGGWLLLNHAKYRMMASKDEEKTASALRQAAFRERQKRNGKVTARNARVTACNDAVTAGRDIADTDTDTDTEEEKKEEAQAPPPPKIPKKKKKSSNRGTIDELQGYAKEIGLPASDGEFMFDHWEENGWMNGRNPVANWKAGIRKWKSQGWLPSIKNAPQSNHGSVSRPLHSSQISL